MPATSLTQAQLSAFYKHISLPEKFHNSSPSLDLLTAIQYHSLATIPFENLSLHYSPTPGVSIDPVDVFSKIVDRNVGRGGYCMENNLLMNGVLRAAGFNVWATGARIIEVKDGEVHYNGWSHMLNIISLPNTDTLYSVDIGYGTSGPTHPLPLLENQPPTQACLPSQSLLTLSKPFPHTPPMWHYNYRHTPSADWTPAYAFHTYEFSPADFEVMNFWTSRSKEIFFTREVVCAKMMVVDGELGGFVSLHEGFVKTVKGGEKEERKLGSEEERVKCLKEDFGLELNEEEVKGIRGTVAELKGNKESE